MKQLLRSQFVQMATSKLAGAYLHMALHTTRWRIIGAEHLADPLAGRAVIAAFWHERLPMLPALWFYLRRQGASGTPRVLVSRHRDGRFIGEAMRRFGVRAVHGSSAKTGSAQDMAQKGGAAGVRALLSVLAANQHVLITPDGPRGPPRQTAAGVAQIAALSGAAVLPLGAQTTPHRLLPTWDRMVLPLPFGRGVIVCGPPIRVPRRGWEAALPVIQAALTAATDQADALCRP